MHIGIDATRLYPESAGYHKYLESILLEMPGLLDKKDTLSVFINRKVPKFYFEKEQQLDNTRFLRSLLHPKTSASRTIWEHFVLPLRIYKNRAELTHSTYYTAPKLTMTPVVLTLPSLLFLTHPKLLRKPTANNFTRFFPKSVSKATAIITPSRSIKKALIKSMKIPEDKLYVIPYGIDPLTLEPPGRELSREAQQRYSLPEKYILFHGEFSPVNNIKSLIDAYFVIKATKKTDLKLVLVSAPGEKRIGYDKQISELHLKDAVIILDNIKSEDLDGIYTRAELFVSPSYGGGCQSELLKAMANKTPVLTSTSPELDEVAEKNAAVRVDPDNLAGLRIAMEKLLTGDSYRKKQGMKGYERARSVYSWEDAALRTLEVYRKVFLNSYSKEYRDLK